ncbi:hypothetical protein [Hymenobacter volaticus]|uniref:Uncharacterized protein n=1 Tax=Hymenobacter volaticus TaxID=2932254 RepID=A0ABY4GE68_9BACT|nr:hypothetical protein [Hymenobacter volaticus]UOQ69222.1 hypothetical protein MUN86_27600 [Hymenobacter volaticus]
MANGAAAYYPGATTTGPCSLLRSCRWRLAVALLGRKTHVGTPTQAAKLRLPRKRRQPSFMPAFSVLVLAKA